MKKLVLGLALGLSAASAFSTVTAKEISDAMAPTEMLHSKSELQANNHKYKNLASGPQVIEAVVMYEEGAVTHLGGLLEFYEYVQDNVDYANEVYANSGLELTVKINHVMPYPYAEERDGAAEVYGLLAFRSQGQLFFNDVGLGTYDHLGGDVFIVMEYDNSNACTLGGAAGIGTVFKENFTDPTHPLTVISVNCASPVVLAHELGHVIGGDHVGENSPFMVDPYARASACGNGATALGTPRGFTDPRVVSSPEILVNGVACGDAETANMKKVYEDYSAAFAGIAESSITNDQLTLSASTNTLDEEQSDSVVITLTRNGNLSETAQFAYSVKLSGGDFSPVTSSDIEGELEGLVIFEIGESEKSFEISAVNDSAVEQDEAFTFSVIPASLSALEFAAGQSNEVVVSIQSGDTSSGGGQNPPPAPPSDGGSGGGGSTPWWLLVVLSGLVLARRR